VNQLSKVLHWYERRQEAEGSRSFRYCCQSIFAGRGKTQNFSNSSSFFSSKFMDE
jgi:hypothetical protein